MGAIMTGQGPGVRMGTVSVKGSLGREVWQFGKAKIRLLEVALHRTWATSKPAQGKNG